MAAMGTPPASAEQQDDKDSEGSVGHSTDQE